MNLLILSNKVSLWSSYYIECNGRFCGEEKHSSLREPRGSELSHPPLSCCRPNTVTDTLMLAGLCKLVLANKVLGYNQRLRCTQDIQLSYKTLTSWSGKELPWDSYYSSHLSAGMKTGDANLHPGWQLESSLWPTGSIPGIKSTSDPTHMPRKQKLTAAHHWSMCHYLASLCQKLSKNTWTKGEALGEG